MFIPYEKIEEGFKGLSQENYRKLLQTDWAVTEKIHGANFCVIISAEGSIAYAKRKEMLSEGDDFFGYKPVMDALELNFQILKEAVYEKLQPTDSSILVFGELFGGGYPHPEVEPDLTTDLIQTGIFYAPDVRFCVFDMAVSDGKTKQYLSYEQTIDFAKTAGILCAEPLFVGSYDDCLHFDIRFESKIPAMLDLPKLPFPNLAEGVVIKPMKNLVLETENGLLRPILKMKIREFSEVQFHQSEKQNPFQPKGKLTLLTRDLLRFINQNRLNSAISKIGKIKAGDAEKIALLKAELQLDLKQEIERNFMKAFQKLTQAEKEQIFRILEMATNELIDNTI
jgi:Rnl2 family RNA ligase